MKEWDGGKKEERKRMEERMIWEGRKMEKKEGKQERKEAKIKNEGRKEKERKGNRREEKGRERQITKTMKTKKVK